MYVTKVRVKSRLRMLHPCQRHSCDLSRNYNSAKCTQHCGSYHTGCLHAIRPQDHFSSMSFFVRARAAFRSKDYSQGLVTNPTNRRLRNSATPRGGCTEMQVIQSQSFSANRKKLLGAPRNGQINELTTAPWSRALRVRILNRSQFRLCGSHHGPILKHPGTQGPCT